VLVSRDTIHDGFPVYTLHCVRVACTYLRERRATSVRAAKTVVRVAGTPAPRLVCPYVVVVGTTGASGYSVLCVFMLMCACDATTRVNVVFYAFALAL